MDFIAKKNAHDRLLGVTHLEADRELLKQKAPQHDLLKRGIFNRRQDASSILFALLDFATEEEIIRHRRTLSSSKEHTTAEAALLKSEEDESARLSSEKKTAGSTQLNAEEEEPAQSTAEQENTGATQLNVDEEEAAQSTAEQETAEATQLNAEKEEFAVETDCRTLEEALRGADVFLGLSVADILTGDMVRSMADDPIVFALANPNPEISYEKAMASRKDIIFATGRSDYPNQINNVLGFPYIFRGALDVEATAINEEMKLAAVHAIAELTRKPVPESVRMAYNEDSVSFGRDYIIPKALDHRLITVVAPAVAKAAIDSGVARRRIDDWDEYVASLEKRVGHDNRLMRQMTNRAKVAPKRIVFSEGADLKVLQAAEELLNEKIAYPVLVGSEEEIREMISTHKVVLEDAEIFDPSKEKERLDSFAEAFYRKMQRSGITLSSSRVKMKDNSYVALMMLESGYVDGAITGINSSYRDELSKAKEVIGLQPCCKYAAGMHIASTKKGTYFLADTTVNSHPSAETLENVAVLTYDAVKQFDIEPVLAMTSYSSFGEYRLGSPSQVAEAVARLHDRYPEIIVDGEMHADLALNRDLRMKEYPFSTIGDRDVNTIIFPNLSSGSVGLSILKELGNHSVIGPVLLGLDKPLNILPMGCEVRDIIQLAVLTVCSAQKERIDMCRL